MAERGTRLQKLLAEAGVASRRKSEELIRAGKVAVNGRTVTDMGVRVDPRHDRVTVEGRRLPPAPEGRRSERYLALHKPRGVITTRRDPRGRPTVYGFVDESRGRLVYVGRLDRDAEGLLLFTSEGELAHRLTHPRYGIPKEYHVYVEGRVDERRLRESAKRGITVAEGRTAPFQVTGGGGEWRIVLREGRTHEVKHIFAAVGGQVVRLRRVRVGEVKLGALRPGATRHLLSREVRALRRAVGLER